MTVRHRGGKAQARSEDEGSQAKGKGPCVRRSESSESVGFGIFMAQTSQVTTMVAANVKFKMNPSLTCARGGGGVT